MQLFQLSAVSANGDKILYVAIGQLPGSPSSEPLPSSNFAAREASGWVDSTTLAPHPELSWAKESGAVAMTPDLASSIWLNALQSEEQPVNELGLYRTAPNGEYSMLAEYEVEGRFVGASVDLQHAVFTAEKHLLPADADRIEGRSIYEVAGSTLRLVDVDDDGSLLSGCGSLAGEANSISSDGRRIFFTTTPCNGPSQVYMRSDGTHTTDISAPQCVLAGCDTTQGAFFAGATAGGSSAFVITGQRLTDGDTDSSDDLYRYDAASGMLTLVSQGSAGAEVVPAREEVHVSEDGSRVYFRGAEAGEVGLENLYMADAGEQHLVSPRAGSHVEISTNGRYALFSTQAPLVEGDTDEYEDIYRYDAERGTATQISAGPAGSNGPFDNSVIPSPATREALTSHPFRAMSEDGSIVFFDSLERLVPEDRNDVRDVYEWSNGRLGLISSGAGELGSTYVTSTPDGRTALFETADTLLPRDRDGGDVDYYAARIGGGFAEPQSAASCGDSCGPTPPGRLARPAPASARAPGKAIRLEQIDAVIRRRIAASGWIALLAEVPRAGRLLVKARAWVGGREQSVASTSARADEAGPVRFRMRLSKAARRSLAGGRDLRVEMVLHLVPSGLVRRVVLQLRAQS
jgi:hypothetical protein